MNRLPARLRPLFLASLVSFSALTAPVIAESDQQVYEKVDQIVADAQDAVAENLSAYLEANKSPMNSARSEFAELIAKLNKEGRKQIATSLQNRLNNLEETVRKRVDAKLPIVPPPAKPLARRLIGTYDNPDLPFFILIDERGVWREIHKTKACINEGSLKTITDDLVSVALNNAQVLTVGMINENIMAYTVSVGGVSEGDGVVVTRTKQPPRVPSVALTAPREAMKFGNHKYHLIPDRLSWRDAKERCEEMGGHLVTIGSAEENQFVFDIAKGKAKNMWIGMYYDADKNTQVWVTQEPVVFQKWLKPLGPDTPRVDKKSIFVGMGIAGTSDWEDYIGQPSEKFPFVCEWEN